MLLTLHVTKNLKQRKTSEKEKKFFVIANRMCQIQTFFVVCLPTLSNTEEFGEDRKFKKFKVIFSTVVILVIVVVVVAFVFCCCRWCCHGRCHCMREFCSFKFWSIFINVKKHVMNALIVMIIRLITIIISLIIPSRLTLCY